MDQSSLIVPDLDLYEQVPITDDLPPEQVVMLVAVMTLVFVVPFALHIAVGCFGFIHEYLRCFGEKYESFSPRSRRREFIGFQLTHYCVLYDMVLLDTLLGGSAVFSDEEAVVIIPGYFTIAYCILSFVPTVAVKIRRLHDTGRSGWWLLFDFVPLASIVPQMFMWFVDSELGTNVYGSNPKGLLRPEEIQNYIREREADILEEGLVTSKRVSPGAHFKALSDDSLVSPANGGYSRLHDGEQFQDLHI
jgi:uncharacterized membrane protein YhaH (DUF805 family)